MSSWTRSFRVDRATAAAAKMTLRNTAKNHQISKKEEAALPAYLKGVATTVRAAKPAGSHLYVDEVAAKVESDLHRRMVEAGVGTYISMNEIDTLAASQPG